MRDNIWFRIVLIFILVVLFFVLSYTRISFKYTHKIHTLGTLEPHRTGLVLGARIWGNSVPSHVLEDRLKAALGLYRAGKIQKIILSGDHTTRYYDEVRVMKDFMINQGVDRNDIFLDHAGVNTYDSMYRAREIFGIHSMVVVTNGFHLPRALFIANELGIDAVGVKSDLRKYADEFNYNVREIFARIKANVDIVFKPKPKYLGPRIDINGSGVVTF